MISHLMQMILNQAQPGSAQASPQGRSEYAPHINTINQHIGMTPEDREDARRAYMTQFAHHLSQPVEQHEFVPGFSGALQRVNQGWKPASDAYNQRKQEIMAQNAMVFQNAHKMREAQLHRQMEEQKRIDLERHRTQSLAEQRRAHDLQHAHLSASAQKQKEAEEYQKKIIDAEEKGEDSLLSLDKGTKKQYEKEAFEYQKRTKANEGIMRSSKRMAEIYAKNPNLNKSIANILSGSAYSRDTLRGLVARKVITNKDIGPIMEFQKENNQLIYNSAKAFPGRQNMFLEKIIARGTANADLPFEEFMNVAATAYDDAANDINIGRYYDKQVSKAYKPKTEEISTIAKSKPHLEESIFKGHFNKPLPKSKEDELTEIEEQLKAYGAL